MLVERRVGGRTIRAMCAERNGRRAASALAAFESVAARGPALDSGASMRFGWSLLRLVEDADGLLVTEPDFAAWPGQGWKPTIDVTLDVLAAQTQLLRRAGLDGEDACFDEVVLAAPGALAEAQVFLRRVAALMPQDSGWLLGPLGDPEALAREDDLEPVLIAHLVQRRPALLQALAVPVHCVAIICGDGVQQILDPAGRPAW